MGPERQQGTQRGLSQNYDGIPNEIIVKDIELVKEVKSELTCKCRHRVANKAQYRLNC